MLFSNAYINTFLYILQSFSKMSINNSCIYVFLVFSIPIIKATSPIRSLITDCFSLSNTNLIY